MDPASAPQTPRTVRSLKRIGEALEERGLDLSPTLHRQVSALMRGAMEQAYAGVLAATALQQQIAATQERNASESKLGRPQSQAG
ncbi:hypothetical protein OC861_003156 [Tilletia horrida]|nr:hypothetical protein OC861_003156 [Tilletia horrida]